MQTQEWCTRHATQAVLILCATLSISGRAYAKTWEVPGNGTLQSVLSDSCKDGDRIHVAGPAAYQAPASGFVITKSVEIFGDGRNVGSTLDKATVLYANGVNSHVI